MYDRMLIKLLKHKIGRYRVFSDAVRNFEICPSHADPEVANSVGRHGKISIVLKCAGGLANPPKLMGENFQACCESPVPSWG
jgi:hypothetical protein